MQTSYRFGAARRIITQPLGTPLAGYWYLRRAEGVLDDLYARCLAIAHGDSLAVILTLDLINFPEPFAGRAIRRICAETGLRPQALFVSATHTHTGPAISPLMNAEEQPGAYLDYLETQLVAAVNEALAHMQPGRLGFGQTQVAGLAFNRRLLDAGGRVVTYKPDTYAVGLEPAGPVDQSLRVACCQAQDGRVLALLLNFGLHPDTTGGRLISADYPGVLAKALQAELGGGAEVVFINAPCGDVNHLDPLNPGTAYTPDNAQRIGKRLAAAALNLLPELSWAPAAPIFTSGLDVSLKIRHPEAPARRQALETLQNHRGELDKAFTRASGLLRMSAYAGQPVACRVSAVGSGDWVLLGLPGEIFTQTGANVRQASPFANTWIGGLANGYAGYLPPQEAFVQGGYETKLGPGSFVQRGGAEAIQSAAIALLARLYSRNDQFN